MVKKEMIITPELWGPSVWNILQYSKEMSNKSSKKNKKNIFYFYFTSICITL